MKSAKWYKSTFIIVGILPIITAILASLIYDSIKGISISSTFKTVVASIFNWIIILINYEVKVYWIIILFIIILIIVYIINNLQSENTPPKFLDYKEAKPKNLKWTWEYSFDGDNNYDIINLRAHCSKCDTPLIFTSNGWGSYTKAQCPRCDRTYDTHQIDHQHSIRSIIEDDIKKMNNAER